VRGYQPRSVARQEPIGFAEQGVRYVHGQQRLILQTISELILLCIGVVDGLIGLRIILKLIGANPDNEFARLVYDGAGLFLGPFFGLVANPVAGGVVVELSSFIGMLFFALVGWLIVSVGWSLY
jgi:hypothetical protein